MPTSGSRPRAVRSSACASMSDSPLPKRLILRWTMTRSTKPSWRSRGTTCSRNISFISDGTPGRQANAARPILIQMPGAVPTGLGSGSAPCGKEGLDAVSLGHHAVAAGEHRRDRRQRLGVLDQGDAGALGQGLARQVVLGRAQAAGHDHQIGPLASRPGRRRRGPPARRPGSCATRPESPDPKARG